jgi:hypothetical protein
VPRSVTMPGEHAQASLLAFEFGQHGHRRAGRLAWRRNRGMSASRAHAASRPPRASRRRRSRRGRGTRRAGRRDGCAASEPAS